MLLWQLILFEAWCANIASYNVYLLCTSPGANIQVIRNAKQGEVMNYLLAGFGSEPKGAYGALRGEIEGGITYVNFSQHGWNVNGMAEDLAERITMDRLENGERKARIYTLSITDRVARRLETMIDNVEIITINPCPTYNSLQPLAKFGVWSGTIILRILTSCVLGWLSIIPIIPHVGGKDSLALAADQCEAMTGNKLPLKTGQTVAVILSRNDELLDNKRLRKLFVRRRKIMINATHGNTVNQAEEYQQALRQIEF